MIICKASREATNWEVYSALHNMNCSSCPCTCRASRAGGGRACLGTISMTHTTAAQARGVHKALPSPMASSASSWCPQASPPSPVKWGYTVQSIDGTEVSFSYSSWEAAAAMPSIFLLLTVGVGKEEEKYKGWDQAKKQRKAGKENEQKCLLAHTEIHSVIQNWQASPYGLILSIFYP